ncbi:LacI family DNA-binding transcriptional regulator [Streptomyces sp. NPDC049954]|uniref:LacI family DNA-binding transcriptional regulator n=1 Tax=Streptomyces sp. NPDC049954 TaxID=3155779 RepID=UPI00341D32D2
MTTERDSAPAPPPARTRPAQPTILDVAALAGVSKSAVSKVFNNRPGISEPTRRRIHDAARKLGWSPSASATALRGDRTRTVGLVISRAPDLLTTDPYFTELIAGMEQELGPLGYGLQLHLIGTDADHEQRLYERLSRERRVDGFVLTESRLGDARPGLLHRLHMPGLLVGRPWEERPTAPGTVESLHVDGQMEAITAAVDHLVALGHRSIASVAGAEDRVHNVLRRRALEEALAGHGLRPHSILTGEFGNAAAHRATTRLFEGPGPAPTAVLYANDAMALTGIGTLARRGLRVPEDVSVIGYDDLPIGVWTYPGLTTISQDVQLIGRAAALRLLTVLGEKVAAPPEVPPPHLVVRESTGPAPAGADSPPRPIPPAQAGNTERETTRASPAPRP